MDKYKNRMQAGIILANKLKKYLNNNNVLILALPRGGVPVAFEVSKKLHLPLDVFLVRKLGVPGHEELAMGAIASDGKPYINTDIVNQLNISEIDIKKVIKKEKEELLRRQALYRKNKKPFNLTNKTILLIDDGIATGATVKAALEVIIEKKPQKIVVATPVMAKSTYYEFLHLADEIVCPLLPVDFFAVGAWYEEFPQTSDKEVCDLLNMIE